MDFIYQLENRPLCTAWGFFRFIQFIMKAVIETYRGFEISFDTEAESFLIFSDSYDKETVKKSFPSAKKWIDDYLKENAAFKTFKITSNPNKYSEKQKERVITGIRKDGALVYQDENGKNVMLSRYNESDYIIYDSRNESLYAELKKENEYIDLLIKESNERKNAIRSKFHIIEIKDKKAELLSV